MSDKGKVFGIGLSRTGTRSLTAALRMLGYKVHHCPAAEDVLTLAESHDALTDSTVIPHFRALAEQYPDAKFISTDRNADDWLESCEAWWEMRGQVDATTKRNRRAVYGRIDFDADAFWWVREQHLMDVDEFFAGQPERLLVLRICDGEGWDKLCEFLELEAPNGPFPHHHKR